MKFFRGMALASIGASLVACGASRVEQKYGDSVREMIRAQTFDARTLSHPSGAPVIGADPNMVYEAVSVMQKNVSRPEEVRKPITIRLGGEGS
jgi:hypothetical protein